LKVRKMERGGGLGLRGKIGRGEEAVDRIEQKKRGPWELTKKEKPSKEKKVVKDKT